MILVLIGLALFAAAVSWGTFLFVPAVIVAVLAFWSNGVLANFRGDPQAAPDWSAAVSALAAVASVVVIVAALIVR